jgi:hypothetical protein
MRLEETLHPGSDGRNDFSQFSYLWSRDPQD